MPHNAPGELFASARDAGAETAAAMEVDGGVTGGEAATAADAAQSPGGRPKAPCSPGAAHVGGMHANGPAAQAVTVGTAARC